MFLSLPIGTRLSFEDEHSTPLDCFRRGSSDKRTGGVVLQAATLNTLLSGSIFHEPDYLSGSILILFVAVLTVLLCRNRRPLPAAALCAGEVCILGNIGSVKKMVYGAVGDNTNIALRMEELTKEYGEGILISHAVYEQVRGRAIVRPLGAARIRWHSEVTVYAVDGIKN